MSWQGRLARYDREIPALGVVVKAHDPQDDDCAKVLQTIIEKNFNQNAWAAPYLCNPSEWYVPAGALKPGEMMHVQYTEEKKTMKSGPYKSSTHGDIPLSIRGRELLQAEREAVQGALERGVWCADGNRLSSARGDLAKYMSELEANAKPLAKTAWETAEESFTQARKKREERELTARRLRMAVNVWPSLESYFPLHYKKEPTVNDKTNGAGAPPTPTIPQAEKTRSQLIRDASNELLVVQSDLENMQCGLEKPDWISVHANGDGTVADWVSKQLTENWTSWRGKAITAAKARVRKAEKAVSDLLA